MLVKENSSTKVIEDKMGFKFKDLILIGKVESLYMTKIFYKDDKNTFIFFLCDPNEICVIKKITNMQKEYNETMLSIRINEKNYYYKTKEVLLIDDNFEDELQYYYTFLHHDNNTNENFVLSEPLELENEEIVIIELLNSFFDENFLDKKKVNHANL